MSWRTTPDRASTLRLAPCEPSPGKGPAVSVGIGETHSATGAEVGVTAVVGVLAVAATVGLAGSAVGLAGSAVGLDTLAEPAAEVAVDTPVGVDD